MKPPHLDGRGVFFDVAKDPSADADLSRSNPPRTKREHPYNYDPFTIWGQPFPDAERTGRVYADRLMQWDRAKYERLARKHYRSGTDGYERPFDSERCRGDLIEGFLRDWFTDPALKLLRVIEQCNPYTGERTWVLDYHSKEGV